MSLCLGHACMGAYSCFKEGTVAVDSNGEGFCEDHASFLKTVVMALNKDVRCVKCATLTPCTKEESIMFDLKGNFYKWDSQADCGRCGGTGIDPISKEGGVGQG